MLLCYVAFKLLQNLHEYQNRKNDSNESVKTDQGAQKTENNAENRNSREQAQNETANNVNYNVNDKGDDESCQSGCSKSVREKFFQKVHNNTPFTILFSTVKLGGLFIVYHYLTALSIKQSPHFARGLCKIFNK